MKRKGCWCQLIVSSYRVGNDVVFMTHWFWQQNSENYGKKWRKKFKLAIQKSCEKNKKMEKKSWKGQKILKQRHKAKQITVWHATSTGCTKELPAPPYPIPVRKKVCFRKVLLLKEASLQVICCAQLANRKWLKNPAPWKSWVSLKNETIFFHEIIIIVGKNLIFLRNIWVRSLNC